MRLYPPPSRAWLLAALLAFQPAIPSLAAETEEERSGPADQAPADELPPGAEDGREESEAPPDAAVKPEPEGDPSVFVPTEEISEDFAVPFPVDI